MDNRAFAIAHFIWSLIGSSAIGYLVFETLIKVSAQLKGAL